VVFAPLMPDHANRPLFEALVTGQEAHMRPWTHGIENARFRAYATHPGPDLPATDEAAWLEGLGYTATSFGAALVRPHLDDIPDRQLPDGVELRPATDDVLRTIFDAHWAAFVDDWDYRDATESDFRMFVDDPNRDVTLWKIAWAGDTVVGQVKSFINHEENAEMGYLRGYTEQISTAAGWRNRGIAGTLLAMSLRELRDRGMTEAALGVDTDNPGGAFQLYTGLGFELRTYEAIYHRPAN
jgi:mycothiol synthase